MSTEMQDSQLASLAHFLLGNQGYKQGGVGMAWKSICGILKGHHGAEKYAAILGRYDGLDVCATSLTTIIVTQEGDMSPISC